MTKRAGTVQIVLMVHENLAAVAYACAGLRADAGADAAAAFEHLRIPPTRSTDYA